MSNLAISYARFSSAPQAKGDSLRRQIENAEQYAAANNLILDRTRCFQDLGVSAYDQSNVRKGALGLFLKAVENGQIPSGTTLIVESFDRLSRAKPLDALGVFTDILNAGLTIATLTTPPRTFSRDSISDNVFQLMEALLDMYRAHSESKRKSELLEASWKDKLNRAREHGALMSSRAPFWMSVKVNHDLDRKHKDKWIPELIPERAAIGVRIIELAEQGVGTSTIIRTLYNEGVQPWARSGKWVPSYVEHFLKSPALFGCIELDDEYFPLYPSLITRERFDRLQALRSARSTKKHQNRKGKHVTNLFSGLLKCGYCGESMTVAGYKSRKSGEERKYVACIGARTGASNCRMRTWYIDEMEDALLFWLTQIDYGKLLGMTKKSDLDVQQELLASIEQQIKTLERSIENGHAAILQGLDSMIPRVKEIELEFASLKKRRDTQKRNVDTLLSQAGSSSHRMKAVIELFKKLKRTEDDLEKRTLREQLSASVHEVIDRVVMYPMGRNPNGSKDERFMDVLFKNGAERRIEPGEC